MSRKFPSFWINSEGEFGRFTEVNGKEKDEYLGGSVPAKLVDEVTQELFPGWRYSYSDQTKEWKEKKNKVWAVVAERHYKPKLQPLEWEVLQRHMELQALHTSTFRFYGGVNGDEPYLHVSFETYLFLDEKGGPDRTKVAEFLDWMKKEKMPFTEDEMRRDTENEHSWSVDENHKKIEGSDKYGPDHGRPMVQSSVDIDLWNSKATFNDAAALTAKIKEKLIETGVSKLIVAVL
jgi:hypothetical protein